MKKILTYILLILLTNSALAQYASSERLKATFIWEVQKYFTWPDDQNLFTIVLGTYKCPPSMLKELEKTKPPKFLYGTTYIIKNYQSLDELGDCQIFYINEIHNDKRIINKIFNHYQGKPTLIITDEWYDKKQIQINIFVDGSGQTLRFEINNTNILNQGISRSPNFDEIKQLYEYDDLEMQKILRDSMTTLEKELKVKSQELQQKLKELEYQKKQIAHQQQLIKEQNQLIEQKQQEIIQKQQEINQQKQRLQEVYKNLMRYQEQLNQQIALIKAKEKQLAETQNKLNSYKSKIEQQQKKYIEQAKELEAQTKKMREIEQEVKQKQQQLQKLNFTIAMQRTALIIFFLLLIVIGVLLYFIFKNYKIQKQQNILLRQQKEEIESQAEQLEKLSIVASETSNAVAILLPDGKFEWINSGFTRLYGYTLQLLHNFYDNNIENFNKDLANAVKLSKTERKSVTIESKIRTRHNKTIWIQSNITPIINGNELKRIIIIDTNITRIKEAEEEIRRKNEQITKQAYELEQKNIELAKLSIVAENTDNGVIIADSNGKIEWINPGFERMLELSFEEFIKTYGTNIIFTKLPQDVLDKINRAIENKQSTEYSFMLKTPKGKILWLQSTLTPMFDKNGKLFKLFSINADITELKLAHDKIEKQNRDITKSIQYAKRIQQAALPAPELIQELLPKNFILYLPRDIVSGDFYWLTKVHNKILFTAADCTGHGVPGAFMSMLGIAFLNEIIAKLEYEQLQPNIVLNILREYVIKFLRQTESSGQGTKDGMDMALVMLDLSNEELHFAGANNPLWLVRDNQLLEFNGDDMPIGIYYNTHESFTNHVVKFKQGDKIYIFSDGYADQFGGPRGKKFMVKRFRELIKNISPKPLNEQKEILYKTHLEWRGKKHQLDDILVIGVEL